MAHNGACCHSHWANGIQFLNAFTLVQDEVWKFLHVGYSQYPDLQQILIDSTVIRAHACAAGATNSSAQAEALGRRSKGGFTTKIHAVPMREAARWNLS